VCCTWLLLLLLQVELWEAGLMGLVYALYVCLTFYISRTCYEPVHADVEPHDVPQQEGIGGWVRLLHDVSCMAPGTHADQPDAAAASESGVDGVVLV